MHKQIAAGVLAVATLVAVQHLSPAPTASAQSQGVTQHPAPANMHTDNMHTDNMHTDRVPALPARVTASTTYRQWEDGCWQTIPYGPKRFKCFEVGYDRALAGELSWGVTKGWKW